MGNVNWFAVSAAVFGAIAAIHLWRLYKQKQLFSNTEQQPLLDNGEPLKPLWGNGDEIFAKEWVLSLSTKVPEVDFVREYSVEGFYRKLGYYHSAAKAAVSYFPDGKYRIGRDGSMSKIYNEEAGLAELLHVNATIDFMDLPYFETVERRLTTKPTTFMEKGKNCVLLDVHAHGVENGTKEYYMPRFAVRDGKVIVESF